MPEKRFNSFLKTKIFFFLLPVILCFLLPAPALASGESSQRKVILVICDYLNPDDLNRTELTNLHNFFGEGSIALLNTNTAGARNRQNAAVTISAGRVALSSGAEPLVFGPRENVRGEDPAVLFQARTGITPERGNIVVLDLPSIQWANEKEQNRAEPGALGDALHKKGLKTAVIGNSDLPGVPLSNRSAALIAMDRKGIIDRGNVSEEVLTYDPVDPLGHRTNYTKLNKIFLELQPQTDFMVIDLGDLVRLEYKRTNLTSRVYIQERERILREYDDFIGLLMEKTDLSQSLCIVATTIPTVEENSEKRYFGFIGAQGKGLEEGLLSTPTTRKPGVITLLDIAPSIGAFLQADPDPLYIGRSWHVVPEENNLAIMQKVEKRTVFASYLRAPLVKGYVLLHLIVLASILFFLVFDPRKGNCLGPLLLGLIAVPLTLLLVCLTDITDLWLYLALCLVINIVLVLISIWLARDKNYDSLIFLCLATVIALLIDTISGGHLQRFSVLSYDPMGGARFYGIGNEYMGVMMGATIIGVSLLVTRLKKRLTVQYLLAGALFLSVLVVLGAPWWGSNFGGFVASLIAFGYTFLRLFGIRVRPKNILVGLIIIGLLCGGVFVLDFMRPLEMRSHFGQFAFAVQTSGLTAVKEVVVRKLAMNYKLIRYTIWTRVLLCSLLALGILFYRPVGIFRRLLTKNPAIAAGLAGGVLGAFTALIFNDSGIVAAATAIIFPAATLFYLVLREQITLL
jgi:hypothetical protein